MGFCFGTDQMDQILIREMVEADIAAVARLCGDLDYPTSFEQLAGRYAKVSIQPDNGVWVAELDGEVVGWAHGHGVHILEADSYVEIGGIVVDPGCRGLGLGRMLLEACERWAQARGYPRIRLRSGIHRSWAHAFYRRLGYQQASTAITFSLNLPRLG